MRKNALITFCLLYSSIGFSGTGAEGTDSAIAETETGTLVVHVEGFESNRGTARLLLFSSERNYLKRPLRSMIGPIRQRRARFELDGLPFGVYAVAVYQEQERDARPFDFHISHPYRPVAFSNNVRIEHGQRGPPSFSDVRFLLDKAELEMTLVLFR